MKDLCYEVTTVEGIEYSFVLTSEGLYTFKVSRDMDSYVFGRMIVDNKTQGSDGICHVERIAKSIDTQSTEVQGGSNSKGITGVESEAIKTLEGSRQWFSKRDQIRVDIIWRFQYVARFPADDTILHSVSTNSIKNNPITRRDIELAMDMLGLSKYAIQGKTMKKQLEAMNIDIRRIDIPCMIR